MASLLSALAPAAVAFVRFDRHPLKRHSLQYGTYGVPGFVVGGHFDALHFAPPFFALFAEDLFDALRFGFASSGRRGSGFFGLSSASAIGRLFESQSRPAGKNGIIGRLPPPGSARRSPVRIGSQR
jgi:hypothetical protein